MKKGNMDLGNYHWGNREKFVYRMKQSNKQQTPTQTKYITNESIEKKLDWTSQSSFAGAYSKSWVSLTLLPEFNFVIEAYYVRKIKQYQIWK